MRYDVGLTLLREICKIVGWMRMYVAYHYGGVFGAEQLLQEELKDSLCDVFWVDEEAAGGSLKFVNWFEG